MGRVIKGQIITPGVAKATALVTQQPISFCLGVDPRSGRIVDSRHELYGQSVVGTILAFPFGKGSSGAGLVILELIRAGLSPAAIVNVRTEPVLATGAIIAVHFYHRAFPMLSIGEAAFHSLTTGQPLEVNADSGYLKILD